MPRTWSRDTATLSGVWLASRLAAGDMVEDDHAYTHYYAGQVFLEGKEPVVPTSYQPTCYVVVTRSKDSEIGSVRAVKEDELCKRGSLAYHWPEIRPLEEARVVIYAEPWVEPAEHPFVVLARSEQKNTEHAARSVLLRIEAGGK